MKGMHLWSIAWPMLELEMLQMLRTYVNLYIAQVKQKCGIIERENYNKPKSDNAKQPLCPPDKEKAIIEALKHFGMI